MTTESSITFEEFDDFKQSDGEEEEAEEEASRDKENADTTKLQSVWENSEETAAKKTSKTRASGTRKPGPRLTENEMVGAKGLPALRAMFRQHKISSKAGPYENMSRILKKMEYWAHGLYPQLNFDDFLDKAEHIGRKKIVKAAMSKIRMGMPLNDDEVVEQAPTETEQSYLFDDTEDFNQTSSRLFDQLPLDLTSNLTNTTFAVKEHKTSPVQSAIDDSPDEYYFDDDHLISVSGVEISKQQQEPVSKAKVLDSRSPSVSPLPPFFKAKLIDEGSDLNFSASSDSDNDLLHKNQISFFESAKKKKVRIVIPDDEEDDEDQVSSVLNSASLKKMLLKDKNNPYFFSED